MNNRIVVGVDGSLDSKEALTFALAEARRRGARLEVIHAWSFPYHTGEIQQLAAEAAHNALEAAAQQTLDTTLSSLGEQAEGIEIDPHTAEGLPARVLTEAAANADLLVVGSRGRGGLAGLLLGSVSQQCSQLANCPVVIVRRRASPPQ